MKTSRATRPIVRIAPLLAWLVVVAFPSPHASAAGCSHPAASPTATAAASLRLLRIAESDDAAWTLPGAPCNGPKCRSKNPSADAPGVLAVAPERPRAATAAGVPPSPSSSAILATIDPAPVPIRLHSPLERPPRAS